VIGRPGSDPLTADVMGIITWERVAELLEETIEVFSDARE
jgi:hypothetical protein